MVIDTSALIAILNGEPEAHDFLQRIVLDPRPCISAATLIEVHLVFTGRPEIRQQLAELIVEAGIETVVVDEKIAGLARMASDRYGKGTRAKLNFGDLFSYATAKALPAQLLFKGDDFVYTDVEIATRS
ncbi:MAG: type II toxin-antitoxin system VapC family toxin [Bryobacteraceae bacterium]